MNYMTIKVNPNEGATGYCLVVIDCEELDITILKDIERHDLYRELKRISELPIGCSYMFYGFKISRILDEHYVMVSQVHQTECNHFNQNEEFDLVFSSIRKSMEIMKSMRASFTYDKLADSELLQLQQTAMKRLHSYIRRNFHSPK